MEFGMAARENACHWSWMWTAPRADYSRKWKCHHRQKYTNRPMWPVWGTKERERILLLRDCDAMDHLQVAGRLGHKLYRRWHRIDCWRTETTLFPAMYSWPQAALHGCRCGIWCQLPALDGHLQGVSRISMMLHSLKSEMYKRCYCWWFAQCGYIFRPALYLLESALTRYSRYPFRLPLLLLESEYSLVRRFAAQWKKAGSKIPLQFVHIKSLKNLRVTSTISLAICFIVDNDKSITPLRISVWPRTAVTVPPFPDDCLICLLLTQFCQFYRYCQYWCRMRSGYTL